MKRRKAANRKRGNKKKHESKPNSDGHPSFALTLQRKRIPISKLSDSVLGTAADPSIAQRRRTCRSLPERARTRREPHAHFVPSRPGNIQKQKQPRGFFFPPQLRTGPCQSTPAGQRKRDAFRNSRPDAQLTEGLARRRMAIFPDALQFPLACRLAFAVFREPEVRSLALSA